MRRVVLVALVVLLVLGSLPALAEGIRFREVSQAWGLGFRHHHGGSGQRYILESTAGGVVLLDYDLDGDQDVFFVDGGRLPGYTGEEPRSRLYRNDGGRFADVTGASGIRVAGYGVGGAAGDVDNDGDLDLFVTQFGADQLFVNQGDGTFVDGTARAGVADPLWSSSAAFADTDRDGDLDLYITNYVDFGFATFKPCVDSKRGITAYCGPQAYNGLPDRFYRNKGDGTFEDATQAAGFGGAVGPGMGVVFGDVDNDLWPDLYVSNDAKPNFLFRNLGNGTFEDISLLSGTALSGTGRAEAGMGVDIDDYDGDGLSDIIVTNFELETNALYRNLGAGTFSDHRFVAQIAEPSLLFLAFGTDFADFDQDGDLDLVVANGHINDNAHEFMEGSTYRQRNQVFENLGNGKFREDKATGMDVVRVSRGLATGDLDGDGDLEVVIVNSNDLSEVYENTGGTGEGGEGGRWLAVELEGAKSNRSGIGARLELAAGGKTRIQDVRTASSFQSQNALAAHFGLGAAAAADRLTVRWPSGKVQVFVQLPADRKVRIAE
ncbi:MAG TPA: CRTAC1 family protein [Thermoanaerobaculia bacterium]|nr:CRTAC1 family protein [Thermoanaerobaculia bacterium]